MILLSGNGTESKNNRKIGENDMKTEIKLDAKDIQKIIAEKFNVELDKVIVMPFMKDVRHGWTNIVCLAELPEMPDEYKDRGTL